MKKTIAVLALALVVTSCSQQITTFESTTQYVQDDRTKLCFITTRSTDDFVMESVPCNPAVLRNLEQSSVAVDLD